MRIGFMIGNGFDTNIGIATNYKDFYSYFQATRPLIKTPRIYSLMANKYEENGKWGDLELLLGEIAVAMGNDFITDFHRFKNDFIHYLMYEQSRIDFNKNADMVEAIKRNEEMLKHILYSAGVKYISLKTEIEIMFFSFNYTNTLEQCIRSGVFCNSKIRKVDLHYLHGSLSEVEKESGNEKVILGVNGVDQISNYNNNQMLDVMIKPRMNEKYRICEKAKICKAIDSCDLLVIFGASMGITDNYWWSKIEMWLSESSNRRTIICYYYNDRSAYKNIVNAVNNTPLRKYIDSEKLIFMSSEGLFEYRELFLIENKEWYEDLIIK